MPDRVLIVEDEDTLRTNIARYLAQRGHEVTACATGAEALAAAGGAEFAVALVDLRLPDRDGLSLVGELQQIAPDTGVIVMTAYGSVETVIDALHSGVHDFMVKPVLLKEVAGKVEKLCEHHRLVRENALLRRRLTERDPEMPVARSRPMIDLLAFVRQIASSNATVLIQGESGSGKEVVARALHDASPRRAGPFLAVNVAAIPDSLIESHLFGHERGAFTGADAARGGMFRAAAGGTLLLDEIGELPPASQAKLLRALETKEILPVGSDRPLRVDVRILAATNADLAEMEKAKRFRSDLYYRMSALKVDVPPLRSRRADIPALAQHLVARHALEHGKAVVGIDGAALRRLLAYPWPGNVRELRNAIERATVVCGGKVITVADLPPEVAGTTAESGSSYDDAMAEFEAALLSSTLERTGGDRREAARLLGLSLATLYRRIERLGLKERGNHPVEEAPESP